MMDPADVLAQALAIVHNAAMAATVHLSVSIANEANDSWTDFVIDYSQLAPFTVGEDMLQG